MARILARRYGSVSDHVTDDQIWSALEERGFTDERAADRLGIGLDEFRGVCIRRWGHVLTAEVDQRAEPGATAQKRGHITRALVDELREGLDRGDG